MVGRGWPSRTRGSPWSRCPWPGEPSHTENGSAKSFQQAKRKNRKPKSIGKAQKAKMKAQNKGIPYQKTRPPRRKDKPSQDHQTDDRGISNQKGRIPPEEKTNHRQDHQDHDRGITRTGYPQKKTQTTNKTTRTTTEGLQAVGLGYCPSIGRSGVALCGGLQGVAPRGI